MRVIQKNPEKLQLKFVPWRLWLTWIGAILLGIAFLPLSASGRLECNREGADRVGNDTNQCQFSYRHVLVPTVDFKPQNFPIQEVQGADVESHETRRRRRDSRRDSRRSRPRDQTWHQLVLHTRGETINMNLFSRRQRSPKESLAQDINQFLNNSEESHLVAQTRTIWEYLTVSLVLIISGLVIPIGFKKTVCCTFDKTSDSLSIVHTGVSDKQKLNYPLQSITGVTVQSRDWGDDDEQHRLVVQIDDEKTVPITEYGNRLGFSRQEATAQRIEEFLGLSN
ncbi:hypothetical protein E1H12_01335 [Geitlerinema sp. P-1104]|uniref:hypothetical protein n=1 Tax=Geitlerinema sp. P-1104 TaxID=2546230 RepID=UPI001476AD71|nr:hypothetical protein [Geitlerinema sp. P-1104]NMG57195.1 hypothetical protein [Geitlerinema sp. P-1104]